MTADLWTEASYDHDAMARTAAIARVKAELEGVMPFLLMARSEQEYGHRRAMASSRLESIALRHGVEPAEVSELADRYFALYREAMMQRVALPEGQDPLQNIMDASQGTGYGSGPLKPDEHDEGPDFSHGYSEVPQGAPGGPVPQVVTPTFEKPQQVSETTAARKCACGAGLTKKGKCKGCKNADCTCGPMGKQGSLRRTAADMTQVTPDTGTGQGSVDMGVGGGAPTLSAGDTESQPLLPAGVGQVTSSRDQVHQKVIAVTASIRAFNPSLPEAECRRVARQVVGRYLFTADVSDVDDMPTGTGGGGGGGGSEHGHSGLADYAMGRGMMSMLPGSSGAGAAGAAGGLADAAELAAL